MYVYYTPCIEARRVAWLYAAFDRPVATTDLDARYGRVCTCVAVAVSTYILHICVYMHVYMYVYAYVCIYHICVYVWCVYMAACALCMVCTYGIWSRAVYVPVLILV